MFNVGDLVVCVDDEPSVARWVGDPLHNGTIYTIRAFCGAIDAPHEPALLLEEVRNSAIRAGRRYEDIGYFASRFRPIRKHSIQIFTDIANGVKQPEKENA